MLGGGEIGFTNDRTVAVRTDWVSLSAPKVDDFVAQTWPEGDVPNPIDPDLAVTDPPAALDEAARLGVRTAPFQPAPDRRRVLFDPAACPFCRTTQIPPEAR